MRGFSSTDIQKLQVAEKKISDILKSRRGVNRLSKSTFALAAIQSALEDIMRNERGIRLVTNPGIIELTPEEVQKRRDEVLEMVKNRCPLASIPKFQGKELNGDPVEFFKIHYHRYIAKKHPVIFTPDLLKVDKTLLTALRNTVNAAAMPLGHREKITEAIVNGIFSDGLKSQYTAIHAMRIRAQRARHNSKDIDK